MKKIILCADDFALSPSISEGIIHLIENKHLSATSCLVNMPQFNLRAEALNTWQTKIDIGLHFNLTEGKALSKAFQTTYGSELFSLPTLLKLSYLKQLKQSIIEGELTAQINRFLSIMGFFPHFIDGHQHVHQFPIVRDAVIAVYKKTFRSVKPYIRLVKTPLFNNHPLHFLKRNIIGFLTNASSFRRLLQIHHIPHNHSFSGIYAFLKSTHYDKLFPKFLDEVGKQSALILCHPAAWVPDVSKNIAENIMIKARNNEYKYFMSNQFIIDCETKGIVLDRFARV